MPNTKKTLDDLSTAIEAAVKSLRGGEAGPVTKQMTLDEFVAFATREIRQAGKDQPSIAKRRLRALKRSVDGVAVAVAKMIAEDTESESIRVEVTTAFAPTGDPKMDDLTTAGEQDATETSVTSLPQPSGDSLFAENLADVAKALEKLKAELGRAPDKPRKRSKADGGGDGTGDGGDRGGGEHGGGGDSAGEDGWPLDMAAEPFLKGKPPTESEPAWGFDPADGSGKGG